MDIARLRKGDVFQMGEPPVDYVCLGRASDGQVMFQLADEEAQKKASMLAGVNNALRRFLAVMRPRGFQRTVFELSYDRWNALIGGVPAVGDVTSLTIGGETKVVEVVECNRYSVSYRLFRKPVA